MAIVTKARRIIPRASATRVPRVAEGRGGVRQRRSAGADVGVGRGHLAERTPRLSLLRADPELAADLRGAVIDRRAHRRDPTADLLLLVVTTAEQRGGRALHVDRESTDARIDHRGARLAAAQID